MRKKPKRAAGNGKRSTATKSKARSKTTQVVLLSGGNPADREGRRRPRASVHRGLPVARCRRAPRSVASSYTMTSTRQLLLTPMNLVIGILLTGCAESLVTHRRSIGSIPLTCFWPPPPSTSVWSSGPADGTFPEEAAFGDLAHRLAGNLRDAGYGNGRWYMVGARYAHGFSVITRLERIDGEGRSKLAPERWASRFPTPSPSIG